MKQLYLTILLGSLCATAFSQTKIFREVGQDISTSVKPIMESDILVGYLAFTQLEKLDKDSFSYRITIMDENLNDIGVVNFHEQKLRLEDVMIEDNILCLAYVKSNVLGYTYEHRATRKKALRSGKAWMFTQFINLKGEIIKTAQLPLVINVAGNWNPDFIPGSVLREPIRVQNISGKGFVCFYGDDVKKSMIFYDMNGETTWEKRFSEAGDIVQFMTSEHDVYLITKKEESVGKYQYTIHSYDADNQNTYPKYILKDKKGNNLLALGFENDPVSGKPDISGLIYNPKFRKPMNKDEGLKIRRGMYGGVFNIQLNGHKKGEIKEQFTYWYDESKSNVTAKGYFESGDGYITPNKSFRDFYGNTYYTGSVINSKVRGSSVAWNVIGWGLIGARLALFASNPLVGAAVAPGLALSKYRSFPAGSALVMKMDSAGKLKYESTLPVKGRIQKGGYNYYLGAYCFTVVSSVDRRTYLIMADEKAYVIYSMEQKKVIRTIKRDDNGKSVTVLPAKEGSIIVSTVNSKEKYTMMSVEAI